MSTFNQLGSAFAVGEATPGTKGYQNNGRFIEQSYYLSKLSHLIYPYRNNPEDSQSLDAEDEIREDLEAEKAKKAYRDLRPWYKAFLPKSEEQKTAEATMNSALDRWASAAENRIRKQVSEIWNGDEEPDDLKVEFFSNGGTQFCVARDPNSLIIAFRGTEPKKRVDILTDLFCFQGKNESRNTGKVHGGFAMALDLVWPAPTVESNDPDDDQSADDSLCHSLKLPEILNQMRDNDQVVWITGHSLGGALATLAADRLIVTNTIQTENIGGVFTYGQPRVGNREFATNYPLRSKHYRFVNNNDAVTQVPPKSMWLYTSIMAGIAKSLLKIKSDTSSALANEILLMGYSDTGRVVYIDRSKTINFLKKDFVRRGFKLITGRIGSRFSALGSRQNFINRFLPGLTHHAVTDYVTAILENLESASESADGKPEAGANSIPSREIE